MRKHLLVTIVIIFAVMFTACSSGSGSEGSDSSAGDSAQSGSATLTPFQPDAEESSSGSSLEQDQAVADLLLGNVSGPEGFDDCVSEKIGPDRLESIRLGESQVEENDLKQAQACLQIAEAETESTSEPEAEDFEDVEVPDHLKPSSSQDDDLQPSEPIDDDLQPSQPKDDDMEPPGSSEDL